MMRFIRYNKKKFNLRENIEYNIQTSETSLSTENEDVIKK
jgi:hypothetical protein